MDQPLAPDRSSLGGIADPKGIAVSDQALWSGLAEDTDVGPFATAWLALQCRMIAGVRRGVVLPAGSGEEPPGSPLAAWPDPGALTPGLASVADLAVAERRGVFWSESRGEAGARTAHLAYPVLIDGRAAGVVALEAEGSGRPLRGAMRQLQWGVAGLRDRLRKALEQDRQDLIDRTAAALRLVAVALEEEGFQAACRAAVTELALSLGCERVSIGFVRHGQSRVAAISHSAEFGKQMNLVRMLAAAMDEAVDQRAALLYPDPAAAENDEPLALRAHADLARGHGAAFVLTLPLFVGDRFAGALVCERAADRPIDQRTIDLLDGVGNAIGPILEEKRRNDRWIVVKIAEVLANQARRLLGPGHLVRKLIVVAALALVAVFWVARGPYRVTADAVVEGVIQREVVAALDGFIQQAPVRAGDTVAAGDLLAALDDRDLALERLRWVTERQQLQFELQRALGERNRAETNIVRTQIDQAEAQIRLIDAQLARTRLHAPFDALIVSGDLTQAIGAAVRRGDVLFKLAPLTGYRVVLRVDEAQIGDVHVGQRGDLLVVSLPDAPLPFEVEKITPVSVATEGRNAFEVEARLTGDTGRLRPGMEGVGKIDIEERRLIWIWTRSLLDWVRLTAWKWAG